MSKLPPHNWYLLTTPHRSTKRIQFEVCWRCGLMRLKNEATEKRIRKGCEGSTAED